MSKKAYSMETKTWKYYILGIWDNKFTNLGVEKRIIWVILFIKTNRIMDSRFSCIVNRDMVLVSKPFNWFYFSTTISHFLSSNILRQ